ncbi:MAG: hypothetical protein EKK39_14235 [Sphingobacteriales bacterium]|nr:MAG: hypothetical protein EKK39_14235 [Sphingobacteriales bacterium]
MATIYYEIQQLYEKVFNSKPYVVPKVTPEEFKGDPINISKKNPYGSYDTITTSTGGILRENLLGTEIWLPTSLQMSNGLWFDIPYCSVRFMGSSTWVETPMAERRGSVKELYSIDDYKITIKGFFIDKSARIFPEEDLKKLKQLHEMGEAFSIYNALINIFLDADTKVVMNQFELLEVDGGRTHVRPFMMQLKSDNIFTLEYTGK